MSEQQFPQQRGQQAQVQSQGGMQQPQQGQRLQDVQSPQEASAINAITSAIQICEWCADQCIADGNPAMAECIRLCEDVSELGEASQVLLSRKSNYSIPVLQTLEQAIQACTQECSRHQQAHCQDCASTLSQSLTAIQQLTGTAGQQHQQAGGMTQAGSQQPVATPGQTNL